MKTETEIKDIFTNENKVKITDELINKLDESGKVPKKVSTEMKKLGMVYDMKRNSFFTPNKVEGKLTDVLKHIEDLNKINEKIYIDFEAYNGKCGFGYAGNTDDFYNLIYSLKIHDETFFNLLSEIFKEINKR